MTRKFRITGGKRGFQCRMKTREWMACQGMPHQDLTSEVSSQVLPEPGYFQGFTPHLLIHNLPRRSPRIPWWFWGESLQGLGSTDWVISLVLPMTIGWELLPGRLSLEQESLALEAWCGCE